MSKHTPGPWSLGVAYVASGHNAIPVRVGDPSVNGIGQGNAIAIVHMGGGGAVRNDLDEIKANARLIAAAPDLLAALQELVAVRDEQCERHGHPPDGIDGRYSRARAAIAKAGGSQ